MYQGVADCTKELYLEKNDLTLNFLVELSSRVVMVGECVDLGEYGRYFTSSTTEPTNFMMQLVRSCCKYLGSVTFFLVGNIQDLYFKSLRFLFLVLTRLNYEKAVEQFASKSILQLLVHGKRNLSTDTQLSDLVSSTSIAISTKSLTLSDDQRSLDSTTGSNIVLVVEGVIHVLNESLSATALLFALGEPVITEVFVELSLMKPNPTKVEFYLQILTQIIRFCDVRESRGDGTAGIPGHALHTLLMKLWPIMSLLNSDEDVDRFPSKIYDSVFNVLCSCILNAWAVVNVELSNIAISIIRNFKRKRAVGAAIDCATALIETVFASPTDDDSNVTSTLSQLFLEMTMDVFTTFRCGETNNETYIATFDAEDLEKYFKFVHGCLLHCPGVMCSNDSNYLKAVVQITITSLLSYPERENVRANLLVIQTLFTPTCSTQLQGYQSNLLGVGCTYGNIITELIMKSIAGGLPSYAWSYLGDTLLSIVIGCYQTEFEHSCREWVHASLFENSFPAFQKIQAQYKEIVFTSILRLSVDNPRLFKAMIQDFAKVCNSEMSTDSLLAYES